MRHNVFLHFLNRDANLIAGLNKSLKKKDQILLLNRAVTIAAILCEEFCISPPGFLLETEVAISISQRKRALISSGVIKFPLKENSISAYVEKKRREYNSVRHSFKGLFNDKYILQLTSALPYFILRKVSVGLSAATNWEKGPDVSATWMDLKNNLSSQTLSTLLSAPKKLIETNKALTWEALSPFLNEEMYANETQIRYLLQHNYFALYTNEYNLIVLKDIPLFNNEFDLPTCPKAYSHLWFTNLLAQIKSGTLLDASGEFVLQLLRENVFIRFIDTFIKTCEITTTITDLRFLADIATKKRKIKWEKIADKWAITNSYGEYALHGNTYNNFLEAMGEFSECLLDELKNQEDNIILGSAVRDGAAYKKHNMKTEVVIIATANKREYTAVMEVVKNETTLLKKQTEIRLDKVLPYTKGYIKGKNQVREIYVVRADETGGLDASDLLRRIMKEFIPSYIFFVGCAALLDEKMKHENNMVFVATRAIDSDKKEIDDKGTNYDLDTEKGDVTVVRNINLLSDSGVFDPILVTTNRHFISGSAFSRSRTSKHRKDLVKKFPGDAVVLEMEAYSILKAIKLFQAEGHVFNYAVIKGISDLGDNNAHENKAETQKRATRNAMNVISILLNNI